MSARISRHALAALVLAIVTACDQGGVVNTPGLPILLRYGRLDGFPAALIDGTLSFRGSCIWVEQEDGTSSVILWPGNTTVRLEGVQPVVQVGDLVLREGDGIQLGGGSYSDKDFVAGLLGTAIPDSCVTQLYWLASSVSSP